MAQKQLKRAKKATGIDEKEEGCRKIRPLRTKKEPRGGEREK